MKRSMSPARSPDRSGSPGESSGLLSLSDRSVKHIEDATTWLRKSHEVVGQCGFSIGFDVRQGWLAPYAETTGYIIPTLLRLARYGGVAAVQDMAFRSAEWLLKIQRADGSFPDYRGRAGNYKERPPVVFNTAQDVFGVLAC